MDTILEWVIYAVTVLIFSALMTGCAGIETRGALGLYAVDHSTATQTTTSENLPLICRIKDCSNLRGS